MKLIKAYIRPIVLNDVYHALHKKGFCCMSVFEGEGTGSYSDPAHQHGSLRFSAMHTHVVKIELATESANVDEIINILRESGSTGQRGDGMVFVTEIDKAVRLRDGKVGKEVL